MVGMSSRVSMGGRRRRRGWKENQGPMLDTRTCTHKTCTKRMLCQRQDTRDTQPYTGKTDGTGVRMWDVALCSKTARLHSHGAQRHLPRHLRIRTYTFTQGFIYSFTETHAYLVTCRAIQARARWRQPPKCFGLAAAGRASPRGARVPRRRRRCFRAHRHCWSVSSSFPPVVYNEWDVG